MNLQLSVWRQKQGQSKGKLVDYQVECSEESSFLEMLDILNEQLVAKGEEPIVFDHDCREGICGSCSLTINGNPHGPEAATTACQLHMRSFKSGDRIVVEPFRAQAFPIVSDLLVDRTAFDKILQSGGFITARTGSAVDANEIPIAKQVADAAMDAAACIGCGACVAACPNASAMLYVGAKATHLNSLPQGKAEKDKRSLAMVNEMDAQGFGNCTNYGECSAVCPKEIQLDVIAQLNRNYGVAKAKKFFAGT